MPKAQNVQPIILNKINKTIIKPRKVCSKLKNLVPKSILSLAQYNY